METDKSDADTSLPHAEEGSTPPPEVAPEEVSVGTPVGIDLFDRF
jgi:hypothetical protein